MLTPGLAITAFAWLQRAATEIADLTVRNARNAIVLQSAGVGGYAQESLRIQLDTILIYGFTSAAIQTDRTSTLFIQKSTLAGLRNHIQIQGAADIPLTPGWTNVNVTPFTPTTDAGGALVGSASELFFVHGGGSVQIDAYDPATHSAVGLAMAAPKPVNANSGWTVDESGVIWYLASDCSLYSMSNHTWTALESPYACGTAAGAGTAIVAADGGQIFGTFGGGSPWIYHIAGNYPGVAQGNAAPGGFAAGAALASAGEFVYALRGGSTPDFYRYSAYDGTWTTLAPISNPANPGQTFPVGVGASMAWDGRDWIYATPGGNGKYFLRYHIPSNTWELLGNNDAAPPDNDMPLTIRAGASLLRVGDQLYAVPGGGQTGFWSFARVSVYPVKLKMDAVAMVGPESATQIPWINSDLIHDDDYTIDPGASTWVAGSLSHWQPDPMVLPMHSVTYTGGAPTGLIRGIPSVTPLSSTLSIPASQVITDLNLTGFNLYATGTFDTVYLTAPDGTTAEIGDICPDINTINITLDDEAIRGLRDRCGGNWSARYWDRKGYRPYDNLLSTFDGKDSQGTWTLTIHDNSGNYWWEANLYGWSLQVSTGPMLLTYDQVKFVNPLRYNYRTGQGTALSSGYRLYHPDVSVVPSGGDNQTTFISIQSAIDSGANRVTIQPGVYNQSFYLLSGVDVVGSGAELTVIQPVSPIQAAGVMNANLQRVTLADNSGIAGFIARSGARFITFARNIVRGLGTGVQVSGSATDLEVNNNDIISNGTGLLSTGCAPLDVRNTVFANNTAAGLSFSESCSGPYLHSYNDYWDNGEDIAPLVPGPGEIFLDPLFVSPLDHNYRTAAYSPLGNAGNPTDAAPPGTGERVDIGYIEQGRASFYVDDDYCAACVNDNLTWDSDAFNTIQDALLAAQQLIASLGTAPDQPVSVGVAPGTYTGPVSIPSYVRLMGSGPHNTILINAGESAVAFTSAVAAGISGFSIRPDPNRSLWHSTVAVDNPSQWIGDYAGGISLKLLPNGQPRFAYGEPYNDDLHYAEFNGTAWVDQTVDTRPSYPNNRAIDGVSLALDAEHHPHISYYGNNQDYTVRGLHYAAWDGSQWQITDLDPQGSTYTSIAIDSHGYPHIAYNYTASDSYGVRYISWDGSQWAAPATVETGPAYSTWSGVSLQLDPQDHPHISYQHGDNPHGYTVRYAAWDGSAWSLSTVDSGYFSGDTALRLDSHLQPRVVYYSWSPSALRYARLVDSTWQRQDMGGASATGYGIDLALDSADNPYIAYNSSGSNLSFSHYDGYAWQYQTIDSTMGTGRPVSLALDDNDSPHILTFANMSGINDYLYFAQNGPGTGITVDGSSNDILISRNDIVGHSIGIRFAGRATGRVEFNTLANNSDEGILSSGAGTWVRARNNILKSVKNSLHTQSGGLILNDFNLVYGNQQNYNDEAGTGLAPGLYDLVGQDPLFKNPAAGDYDLLPASPGVDAADPTAPAPAGGGSRADLGASELIAAPLMAWLGKENVSAAIGNSKVASVDLGVVPVADPGSNPDQTLPADWTSLSLTPQDRTVAFWNTDYTPQNDGLYRVYSRASDHVANQEQDPQVLYEGEFIADGTPPVVTWITPGDSVFRSSFELQAAAADYAAGEYSVAQTYFIVQGIDQPAAGRWSPEPWNPQAQQARAFSAYLKGIPDGVYTVTPYARDLAGNLGQGPAIQITISGTAPADNTPPVLTINQPATEAVVRSDPEHPLAFAGTVSDADSGTAGVEVSLDGGVSWMPATVNGTAWTLSWMAPTGLDSVSFPLRYRASDQAGNQTTTERTLFIDNTPPQGLSPVTLTEDPEMHFDSPTTVQASWNPPLDGSGATEIRAFVDHSPETPPDRSWDKVIGTTYAADFGDHPSPWYLHLSASDPAGNIQTRNFGPWFVGMMGPNLVCSSRRQSIQLDGQIDVNRREWLAGETLDEDERPAVTQSLLVSWDAGGFYLGWRGSWWDVDGSLWAYLDTGPDGAPSGVAGSYTGALPPGAEYAVQVTGSDVGKLYRYTGSSWLPEALTFQSSPLGDTEVRVPWNIAQVSHIRLLAFALDKENQPRSVFPTTNPLSGTWTDAYVWDDPCSSSPPNASQPVGRTISALIQSEQADQIAWSPDGEAQFTVTLTNLEKVAFTDLKVNLEASDGLSLESVTIPGCSACTPEDVRIPSLAAGSSQTFTVSGHLWNDLGMIDQVWLSVQAERSAFSAQIYRHAADGQSPSVTILALPGNALGVGSQIVAGTAEDPGPAGLDRVEIQAEGQPNWTIVSRGSAWAAAIQVPVQSTFTLKARAVDAAGNQSQVTSLTFIVDQIGPNASLNLPGLIGGAAVFSFGGMASDPYPAGAEVARVEIQTDVESGAWIPAAVNPAQDGGGQAWSFTWRLPTDDRVEHRLRVRAVDRAGNVGEPSEWQTTLVDTVAPALSATQLLSQIQVEDYVSGENPGPAVLEGMVADPSGVARLDAVVVDSSGNSSVLHLAHGDDGRWQYLPVFDGLQSGSLTIRVETRDGAGNQAKAGPFTVVICDQLIQGLQIIADSPVMAGEQVTFMAGVAAGTNVSYTWNFGGQDTGEGAVVSRRFDQPGTYPVTVTATNNSSSATETFQLEVLARTSWEVYLPLVRR